MRKVVREDDAPVARHRVHQARCAGDAAVGAVDEAHGQHERQDCRGGAAARRLEDELGDGHAARGGQNGVWVDEAEEDDEDEGGAAIEDVS